MREWFEPVRKQAERLEPLLVGAIALLTVTAAAAQDCAQVEGTWPWCPATAAATAGSLALFNSGAVLQVVEEEAARSVLRLAAPEQSLRQVRGLHLARPVTRVL